MRIGILTYHRAINYGAVMQAYSLQKRVQEDFSKDTVDIIDYNHIKREIFVYKCPLVFLYRRSIAEGIKKFVQTKEFRCCMPLLKRSKTFLGCSTEKIEAYMSAHYDVIIVGSDAVFNWNDIGLPSPYFLGNVHGVKKMSYAASAHLQRYYSVDKNQQEYLKNALKDFSYIGVRDDNTAHFVASVLDVDVAQHNCDPSIFLDLNFDEMKLKRKMKKLKFDFNKKTVFVMLMHPEYGDFVKRYFGEEYQIVALMDGNKYADLYLHNLNPFEWAKVFQYGHCLVTDYFHGTIFGLKNGLPVLSIDTSGYCSEEYESKAHDLLHKRLNIPMYYAHASEFFGEDGYGRFADKLTDIIENHKADAVAKALESEARSYEDFKLELAHLHNEN